MTRIIVIGDSQAGCFKGGWDLVRHQHPGVELEVFAAPYPRFGQMVLRGREFGYGPDADPQGLALVRRINGRTSIDLGTSDIVVWAGYRTGFDLVQNILASTDIDDLREAGASQIMSEAAFAAVAEALACQFIPRRPWRDWRAPRLVVAERPLLAEGCLTAAHPRYQSAHTLANNPTGVRSALESYRETLTRKLATHGIALLPQPDETLTSGLLTAEAFSRGSRRIVRDVAHPPDDYVHMNADYGRACITALLTALPILMTSAPEPANA